MWRARGAGAGKGEVPLSTKIILSHHDYDETPGDDVLDALVQSHHLSSLVDSLTIGTHAICDLKNESAQAYRDVLRCVHAQHSHVADG